MDHRPALLRHDPYWQWQATQEPEASSSYTPYRSSLSVYREGQSTECFGLDSGRPPFQSSTHHDHCRHLCGQRRGRVVDRYGRRYRSSPQPVDNPVDAMGIGRDISDGHPPRPWIALWAVRGHCGWRRGLTHKHPRTPARYPQATGPVLHALGREPVPKSSPSVSVHAWPRAPLTGGDATVIPTIHSPYDYLRL